MQLHNSEEQKLIYCLNDGQHWEVRWNGIALQNIEIIS